MGNGLDHINAGTPATSSERGATATEYAILLGFLVLVMVFGLAAFGLSLGDYFISLSQAIQTALP
ncbi:Flp family type IVb pilin [Sinomonas soli]